MNEGREAFKVKAAIESAPSHAADLPAAVVRRTEPRRDPDAAAAAAAGGIIRPVHVRSFPVWMARFLPRLLVYVLKTLWHSIWLLLALPGIFNLPALVILQVGI